MTGQRHVVKKRKQQKKSGLRIFGHICAFMGVTLGLILIFVIAVVTIVFRGPSEQASKLLTLSANETSAMKWLPGMFLPKEKVDEFLNVVEVDDGFEELPIDTSLLAENVVNFEQSETEEEIYELIDIKGPTYKGKMLKIHDPSLVHIVAIKSFGGYGLTLGQFSDRYDALAVTNAGGFEDAEGKGTGGIPEGLVIQDGKLVYGSAGAYYPDVIGFDQNHVLHVGDMSGSEALAQGIVEGTNFKNGPVLVKDGVKNTNMGSGINPRTCIGQCADGTILLMALEGRFPDSLGATFEDLADIMLEYGAVNAGNFDGGSSSGLYYEGERVTRSCSVIGDRPLPTAVVVLRKGDINE